MNEKLILDAACGGKSFWFDKSDPNTLFIDKRHVEPCLVGTKKNSRIFECNPDMIMDFTAMKFSDESFSLVVFDPPHLTSLGKNSYMAKKYGALNKDTWQVELQQ